MRALSWRFGHAWLAAHPREWKARLWDEPMAEADARTFTFPASSEASPEAAVVVELKFQTGCPAYFACLGGHLRPGQPGQLAVTIRLPAGCEEASQLLASVVAGLESLPERPAGHLEISWFAVHPVDFSLPAWERSARTLGRLLLPDVAPLSDAEASSVASEWAVATPWTAHLELVVKDDVATLVDAAAGHIREAAAQAVSAGRRFRVALAGGSTPRALYPRLVTGIDWTKTDVFLGDERVVPLDDPRSNYRMVRETLLEPARVPEANVFRWRTESADLDGAARDYERALRARDEPPWLDLVLLGLGPDGHTASLFPGTTALAEGRRLAVPVEVPELAARRLTLTYPALLRAREVMFLVTGADKRAALTDVLRPASALPAARIVHRRSPVTIFCDQEAARDIGFQRA